MSRKAILLAIGLAGGLGTFGVLQTPDVAGLEQLGGLAEPAPLQTGREAAPPETMRTRGILLGQTTGTFCSTPKGSCVVPEGPINSFCSCNGVPGRIIR